MKVSVPRFGKGGKERCAGAAGCWDGLVPMPRRNGVIFETSAGAHWVWGLSPCSSRVELDLWKELET